ncbi:MAG: hypothetical protein PGN34_05685 [Methylobacterium frigidaeris]
MATSDNLDVLGTFLRTVQPPSPVGRVVVACPSLGSRPTISDLFRHTGLSEDRFAKVLAEAETRERLHRTRDHDRIVVEVTPRGRRPAPDMAA